jgi:hypothetical protein
MDAGKRILRFLDHRRQTLLVVSLFLIVVGARAVVINYAGNVTPYADEWDGAAANLLKPYFQGSLTIRDLFRPHNEHVIFFTRLLTLGVFNVSGYWDVVLEMIVNAIVDAATVVAISYALSRSLRDTWALAAIILSVLVNALPLSFDNLLFGLNTHFYLLLAFSFASLWFMAGSRAWSPRWAAGVLFALGSFLCMASGALTFAAAIGLHLVQLACGRRSGRREWLGIAALAATMAVLMSFIPHVPSSDVYGAHSLKQFLSAALELASWPAPPNLGTFMAAPSVLFCLRTFADRPALSDARWFNVAAFGWILTQFAALAAGRALVPVEVRYMDSLLIGLAVNITSFFGSWNRPRAGAIAGYGGLRPSRHGSSLSGRRWSVPPIRCPARWNGAAKPPKSKRETCVRTSPLATHPIWLARRFRISPTSKRPGCANCSARQKFAPPCRRSF